MRARGKNRRRRISGLTLIESLLAAVVLAMAVTAIIMPFSAAAQGTAEDVRQTLAVTLAQDLIEEILSKPFRDPDGGPGGETGRATWDNMADYEGFAEPVGAITSFDGVTVDEPGAVNLTRSASVQSVYVAGQDVHQPATFCRVTVEVRHHDRTVAGLSRLVYAND